MVNRKNTNKKIIAILLITISVFTLVITPFTAFATASSYSNVLDDLERDRNFDASAYPEDLNSSEINVIHIAEGDEGELYIYTYQPGNATVHRKAKYINMSLQSATEKDITYNKYALTWLNSNGVFDKYLVNGFTVSETEYRYYSIAAVYRAYDSDVDDSSSAEAIDTVQCKAYPVGQTWCLYYYNGILMYEMATLEYVDITVWATGSIEYYNGFKLYQDECDSHYVAFSVDNFNVDKIYDADITYTVVHRATTVILSTGYTHYEVLGGETVDKTLTEYDTGGNSGGGLFGRKYTWDRICTVEKFKEDVAADTNKHDAFSKEESEDLDKAQFVFRFAETPTETSTNLASQVTKFSTISEIGILRLHFLADGKVYNLGVVGDLVGTDAESDATVDALDNIVNSIENQDWWQKLVAILLLIVLLVVLMVVSTTILPIIKFIISILASILSLFLSILTFPIRALTRKRK